MLAHQPHEALLALKTSVNSWKSCLADILQDKISMTGCETCVHQHDEGHRCVESCLARDSAQLLSRFLTSSFAVL